MTLREGREWLPQRRGFCRRRASDPLVLLMPWVSGCFGHGPLPQEPLHHQTVPWTPKVRPALRLPQLWVPCLPPRRCHRRVLRDPRQLLHPAAAAGHWEGELGPGGDWGRHCFLLLAPTSSRCPTTGTLVGSMCVCVCRGGEGTCPSAGGPCAGHLPWPGGPGLILHVLTPPQCQGSCFMAAGPVPWMSASSYGCWFHPAGFDLIL